MRIVCIESPFTPSADDIATYVGRYSAAELLRQNLVYARLALMNSLKSGESPICSHLLYTQVCNESHDLARKAGIEMQHRMDLIALYADLGVSDSMRKAASHAKLIDVEQTRRFILDAADVDAARRQLGRYRLDSFLDLETLQGDERAPRNAPATQPRAPGRVIPFRRPSAEA